MADSDFSVYARIQADTSNFEKGMKNAQTSASNLSKSFGNLSKVITKALSFVGLAFSAKSIADFGKSSVQSATQATKQFKILDNTVKATGADAWTSTKQLEGLAKELSNETDYSVTELENMESVLLGFRNITDDTFSEASEAILDMATVMGMDLKSAAQTVGKALDDPIKGLDSLRRQGFQFTDEQKEELAQLVKNGEQIKAQKIILDELAQSYGGAARAGQDSFAKQRHAMENLKDEVGGKLIPVLQVFAEENAKVLDALREKIEQINFSKAVNVVTNLKNIFIKRFEEIKQRVTVAKDSIVDFLKRFNFGPVVSILDTLIGHLVETVKMFREMQGLNFGSLKEGLIELSNSEAFEKFATFFNAIIDVSHGILEEVKKVWPEIRDTIVNAVIGIWNKIKELFEKSNEALNESGQDIHSWADLFWKELDNIYRIAQDLLKGVTYLLKGDWATAWEYAKLAVLRVADGVLDAISTIANGMPKIINKIIDEWNRVLGWINKGLEKINKDPIDLVPEFKSVDLSDVIGVADKIEEVENKIQELTGAAADNGINHLDKLSGRWKGFTAGVLGDIEALTDGTEKGAEKTDNVVTTTASEVEDVVQTTIAKISEWDEKLLQQRAEGLKEYSDEYHQIQMQLLQYEREKALASSESKDDNLKISQYYNTLLEKEDKRYLDAKFSRTKSVTGKIVSITVQSMKIIYDVTKNVFSKVAEVTKQTFSTIINITKNVFGKFKELIEFNFDEGLDKILEFEDGVLTFFVETLPKLPGYLSSVLQSITTLVQTLINNINFENIENILNELVQSLTKNLPTLVEDVAGAFVKLVGVIISVLTENTPAILASFKNIVLTLTETLETVMPEVLAFMKDLILQVAETLETIVPEVLTFMQDLILQVAEELPEIIEKIVPILISIASQILDTVTKIITEVVPKLLPPLMKALDDNLPTLIESLVNFIIETAKLLPDILMNILPTLINAVAKLAITLVEKLPDLLQTIIDALPELIQTIIYAVLDNLPSIVTAVLNAIPQILISVVQGIFNLLHDLIFETDWGRVWEGLVNTFKAVWEGVGNFFVTIWDNIKAPFEAFGKWFKDLWNGIGKWFGNLWDRIVDGFYNVVNFFIDGLNDFIGGINWMLDWAGIEFSYIPRLSRNGSSNVASDFADIKGAMSSAINAVPNAYASGTNNALNGLALVGEAGPELVRFRGGEQVLNNGNTNKALSEMGNKSNIFNVTFNNTQDTTAYAMITQLKQYQRKLAFNGVL